MYFLFLSNTSLLLRENGEWLVFSKSLTNKYSFLYNKSQKELIFFFLGFSPHGHTVSTLGFTGYPWLVNFPIRERNHIYTYVTLPNFISTYSFAILFPFVNQSSLSVCRSELKERKPPVDKFTKVKETHSCFENMFVKLH